jgi:hypothetical protein
MNKVAVRKRFLVLYPEQDRTANAQGCWNWYGTRTGRADREAASIDAAITQICLTQPVDAEPHCDARALGGRQHGGVAGNRYPSACAAGDSRHCRPRGRAQQRH